jgi:hypothetical protein
MTWLTIDLNFAAIKYGNDYTYGHRVAKCRKTIRPVNNWWRYNVDYFCIYYFTLRVVYT